MGSRFRPRPSLHTEIDGEIGPGRPDLDSYDHAASEFAVFLGRRLHPRTEFLRSRRQALADAITVRGEFVPCFPLIRKRSRIKNYRFANPSGALGQWRGRYE